MPDYEPTTLQRANMTRLLDLLAHLHEPDGFEVAELHRESGHAELAKAAVERIDSQPMAHLMAALLAAGTVGPVRYQV